MAIPARPHAHATYQTYQKLKALLDGEAIQLDGESLDLATVVAVSK
jgi:hypothetical protein